MNIVQKLEQLFEEAHKAGYGSELPTAVDAALKLIAQETHAAVEALKAEVAELKAKLHSMTAVKPNPIPAVPQPAPVQAAPDPAPAVAGEAKSASQQPAPVQAAQPAAAAAVDAAGA